jgi:hypothetical protein
MPMSEEPDIYATAAAPTVEAFATFSLRDGKWCLAIWPNDYRPLNGKGIQAEAVKEC